MRETMWKAKEGGTENPVYAYSIPRRTGTYLSTGYLPITTITEPQPCHGLEGLPVDVVANERQVEGQREPLASKHEQNVEQKVQKIFWQYLRKTKVIIINYWIQNKSLNNVPKLQTLRIWIILVRIRMVSKQLKLIQIIQLLSAKKTLK